MELNSDAQNAQATHAERPNESVWVETLSHWLRKTYPGPVMRARTMLSCDVKSSKLALFVPPDMAELQPASLDYLHTFAKAHDLTLIEDRRRIQVKPLLNRRQHAAPMIAKAIGELLNKAGLPGEPPALSSPHRLNDDSPHICITQLLQMAAFSNDTCKHVVLPTNSKLINVLNNDTQPVNAYACNLKSSESATILSYFNAAQFRAIGYSAGSQYIVHVCLAGGPMSDPQMWTGSHTLTRTDFQFQLIQSPKKRDNLGLFYATFYFDLASAQAPWWTKTANDNHMRPDTPVLLSGELKAG